MKKDLKNINARVPEEMYQFLRKYGFERETGISGAIRLIVKEKMENESATTEK